MLILVDARPLQFAGPDNERSRFITMVAGSVAREHGVAWKWMVDQHWRETSLPGIAEQQLISRRALPGRAGWKWWYDWQIPRIARRLQPDWVILTGGIAAGPLAAPQCIWMPVRADPKGKKIVPQYARRLDATLRRGTSFVCFSEQDRSWLAARSGLSKDRFHLVRPVPSEDAAPLSDDERETVKQGYAQGCEFFFADLSAAREEEILCLLKAFSLFKKRQLSNLRLVIAGDPSALQEKLQTYRYRNDVHWYDVRVAREARLPAAAYAVLIFFGEDLSRLPDAWLAGVPALVAAQTAFTEMAGDAALATATDDPAPLAGHLMAVYKDEVLRGRLIANGFSRLPVFAPGPAVAGLWAVLSAAGTAPSGGSGPYKINK